MKVQGFITIIFGEMPSNIRQTKADLRTLIATALDSARRHRLRDQYTDSPMNIPMLEAKVSVKYMDECLLAKWRVPGKLYALEIEQGLKTILGPVYDSANIKFFLT